MSPAEQECGKIIHAMTTALESCNEENEKLHQQLKQAKKQLRQRK